MTGLTGLPRAHGLGPVLAAFLAWTLVSLALGGANIPTFQSGHSLPLWSLYPGLGSALLATGGASALAWLEPQARRGTVRRDRAVIAALLLAASVAGSVAVGAVLDVPRLWVIALVVLALSLGAGAVHPLLPFAASFAAGVVPMVFWVLFSVSQPTELLVRLFGPIGLGSWVAAGALALVVYVAHGFRRLAQAEV